MLARFLYKSYRLFYVLRHWRKRHFTPAGGMIIASIIFSGIFGFNVLKTNLYQVMAFGVSVMGVALGYSLFGFKLKVSIHRILPEYTSIGNKGIYEIQINNLSKRHKKDLSFMKRYMIQGLHLIFCYQKKSPLNTKEISGTEKPCILDGCG